MIEHDCPSCNGTGVYQCERTTYGITERECSACNGTGVYAVSDRKIREVLFGGDE